MFNKKKAFTLSELLVVVIVLGVLAAVAVPKFSRVLETRKTTEAEEIFSAVRTEQESRCVLGKNYLTDKTALSMLSGADNSANYVYTLTGQGITATSGKGYTLKMLSYKDGRICCEGEYCDSLNKNYPSCTGTSVIQDECAGEVIEEPEPGPCDIDPAACACNPNQEKCCSSSEKWEGGECVAKTFCDLNPQDCTCNPNQEKCCRDGEEWNGKQCVPETRECEDGETAGSQMCNGCGEQTTQLCVNGKWSYSLGECSKTQDQCKCQADDLHTGGERNEYGICPCRYGQPVNINTGMYNEAACCAPDNTTVPSGAGCCGGVYVMCGSENWGGFDPGGNLKDYCEGCPSSCTLSCGTGAATPSCSWGAAQTVEESFTVDYQAGDLFRLIDQNADSSSILCEGVEGCRLNNACGSSCTSGSICTDKVYLKNCKPVGDMTSDGKVNAYSCIRSATQRQCVCS